MPLIGAEPQNLHLIPESAIIFSGECTYALPCTFCPKFRDLAISLACSQKTRIQEIWSYVLALSHPI